MLDIVIATDKYKGTLTAVEACDTIHCALENRFPDAHFRICPMADGGEGTASLIAEILNYKKAKISCNNSLFEDIDIIRNDDVQERLTDENYSEYEEDNNGEDNG